ncbi:hypothetical protein [Baaleninema simplex]|uniref:hypothetical protein n=1 Tax=Baaleninema simplex TaxID=2862350 RepID=UPI00034AF083|nr:hypothetical protein [Baaleninema simplex]
MTWSLLRSRRSNRRFLRRAWVVFVSIASTWTIQTTFDLANARSYPPSTPSPTTPGYLWPVFASDRLRQVLLPSRDPLDLELLEAETVDPEVVVRRDTISQTGLTEPSVWWVAEQFGGKLLETWLAYPQKRRIDLVVNRQLWSLRDYLERYEFVNHMGLVARSHRYDLRVFDRQQPDLVLAAYTCLFDIEPVICTVDLERGSQSGFRGYRP